MNNKKYNIYNYFEIIKKCYNIFLFEFDVLRQILQ
jgi:hypothetical protein